MSSSSLIYRNDIDALKGICIIAVVLYHMGILKSGYLGVDAFLVINGFLIIPSISKKISNGDFSFISFIKRRIIRLMPLIILASAVSLGLGYYLMLPDNYENLAQSVIASNVMSENVLSAITTKNYWDVSNEFKPLMHLWYVGILFEFYITFPIICLLFTKFGDLSKERKENIIRVIVILLFSLSLILFLLPIDTAGNKFYFIQYRYFEILFGGILSFVPFKSFFEGTKWVKHISLFGILCILCISLFAVLLGVDNNRPLVVGTPLIINSGIPINPQLALITIVVFTGLFVCTDSSGILCKLKFLPYLGKMSYSIFIWHQVILAFYRYSISYSLTPIESLVYLVITSIVSITSYKVVEEKIKATKAFLIICVIASCFVILPSAYLYSHAGVVRDVPELDVKRGEEHRGMFAEYCDRIYKLTSFPESSDKKNVLVVGISFGRDFANILLESKKSENINIAYGFTWGDKGIEELIKKADYIFSFSAKSEVPSFVWTTKRNSCPIYGIGTKNFGTSNGIIYKNRNSQTYYDQTAELSPGYAELNEQWRTEWGDNYVDMISIALIEDGRVRVFTDDKRFISQDCRHLTQAGAQWYARNINWELYFK